jgi:hypothetical protein
VDEHSSHELLEMLADPDANLCVQASFEGHSRLYAYEVCDPVQGKSCRYLVGGVYVSDFVLPSWFETFHRKKGTAFDQARKCKGFLELLPGGYAQIDRVDGVRGWSELWPRQGTKAKLHGSRRARRRLPRSEWRRSRRG